ARCIHCHTPSGRNAVGLLQRYSRQSGAAHAAGYRSIVNPLSSNDSLCSNYSEVASGETEMLKLCSVAIIVLIGISARGEVAGSAQSPVGTRDIVRALAGKWKAEEYKVPLDTDFDVSVWGRGASKVRNVDLALEPDGDGLLRVHSTVVDCRGKT